MSGLIFLIQIGLITLLSFHLRAEPTTIIADADEMERDTPKQTLTLEGNVNVIFSQQHLLADKAVVYQKDTKIIAEGNVILQTAKTTMYGERLEYNYETNKGTLYKGLITSGQVLLEADEIIKIGEDEYSADNAYFTSCISCPPSWGFTSSNIQAEIGGYAYINRPWLHLLQFPVLPLPYLIVPLSSKRQTGLLVPAQGANPNGGMTFEIPFFWAIDRSQDVTFSLMNYERRGLQGNMNYRYVLSEDSGGELNTAYMKDRVFDNADRWFVEYNHTYDLPKGFTQRSKIVLASDSRYPLDFPEQLVHYLGEAAFDNRNSLTKAFDKSLLTIDSSYYMSLIEPGGAGAPLPRLDPNNSDSLHRMPEINYHMMDEKISEDLNLFFSMDMQYLNVARQGTAFERGRSGEDQCVSTDGRPGDQAICYVSPSSNEFNYGAPPGADGPYGDLIRTGQRFDIMPRLHSNFWLGDAFDVSPYLNMRYTQYALGVDSDPTQGYSSTPSRFYGEFGTSARSYLSGIFQVGEDKTVKHTIMPEVNIRYIPQVHQSNHNFFGAQESLRFFREQQPIDNTDLHWRGGGRGIQFDARDRVIGKQLATVAVTNKIMSRSGAKDSKASSSKYDQELLFRVAQTFDINEQRTQGMEARPWQDIQTDLIFRSGPLSQTLSTQTFPYHNWTNVVSSSRYTFENMSFLQLSYTNFATPTLMPPIDTGRRREFAQLLISLNIDFVQLLTSMEYNFNPAPGEAAFVRWSADAIVTPPGRCWALLVGLEQFMGAPDVVHRVQMEFQFGD